MSGGGNQGFGAAVLPDPSIETDRAMQMLWQHQYRQNQFASMQQQREFIRNKNLSDYLDKRLDNKNFATGDPEADPLIDGQLSALHQKYANLIAKNPNIQEADLDGPMQEDLNNLTQYAAKIKGVRAQVNQGILKYGPNSGIDTEALQKGAMHQALYQGGDQLITDPSKIDPSQDYLENEMMAHPGLYVKGDQPLNNMLTQYKPQELGNTNTSENQGVTTTLGYKAKVYPWQTLTSDSKGNPTGLQTKGVPATLNGATLTDPETNKPMMTVDEPTMRTFATEGVAAQIKRDTDQYITDHGYDPKQFQPGSDAYNLLARHVMYNQLNSLTPSEFTTDKKKTDASIVTKMQLGMVDALGRTITRAEEEKKQELLGTTNGKIRLAASFDPTIVNAGVPYQDPTTGKQFIDVTDAVGGFKTLQDQKSPATALDKSGNKLPDYKQVGQILVDPQNPGKLYTVEQPNKDSPETHIVEYSGSDIDALLTRHAKANGYKSQKDVDEINHSIPIVPNMAAARAARAALELKRRQSNASPWGAGLTP